MDTKDLIEIKKQRIREELEKLVPPGFFLQPHPKKRTEIYDKLDQFLGIEETLARQVGYLNATNKGYDEAIQNLRFFGIKLKDYKDVVNTGPFYNNSKLNKDIEESADYIIRFYDLAEITIKRINDEEDVRLQLLQKQQEKEKQNLQQSEEKKQKATSFFSGATQFRPGKTVKLKVTKLPGIVPRRAVPQEIVEKISKPQLEAQETEEGVGGSKRIVSALGRLALSLEQTNDNLEAALTKIAEDVANTKEQNRKEVDEYRKRVANRGRKLGKRELGSSKVDVSGVVKKYVGSFFNGAGGAIRALALFNMLEAFMNGRPLDALGPLLGIGATYLPQIGGVVAGLLAKKVLGGLFGAARGAGAARGGASVARGARAVAGMPKLGKFAAIAGLGAGALALGSSLFGKKEEEETPIQQKLDQLETTQKEKPQQDTIKSIPDNAIRKFEALNEKFEKALDFLLKKQKEKPQQQSRRRPSPRSNLGPDLEFSQDKLEAISQAAQAVGMKPEELAAIIQAESGGDPQRTNPVSKRVGLIQMGPNEAAEFGVDWEEYKKMTFNEQLNLVVKYLKKRGFKPGMTAEQAYRTVHAGNPNGSVIDQTGVETGQYYAETVEPLIPQFKNKFKDINPDPAITHPSISNDIETISIIEPPPRYLSSTQQPKVVFAPMSIPQSNQQPTPMSMADSGGTSIPNIGTGINNCQTIASSCLVNIFGKFA